MFRELTLINERPAAFSRLTVADLWTDPHVSKQMLRFHLDGSVAISSGTTEQIEATTAWLTEKFNLGPGSRVLDLGCGPGLYAGRLAGTGARVTGVDFSAGSIAHARESAARAGLTVDYVNADYLAWESDERFDLILMIMRDFCAISPEQRRSLLDKIAGFLTPGGSFVFDVDSMRGLDGREESASYESSPSGGFWSPSPHFTFINWFVYADDAVTLEKNVIVEAGRTRAIYNWIQFYSPESLAAELAQSGLAVSSVVANTAGEPFDPASPQFAVVAQLRP